MSVDRRSKLVFRIAISVVCVWMVHFEPLLVAAFDLLCRRIRGEIERLEGRLRYPTLRFGYERKLRESYAWLDHDLASDEAGQPHIGRSLWRRCSAGWNSWSAIISQSDSHCRMARRIQPAPFHAQTPERTLTGRRQMDEILLAKRVPCPGSQSRQRRVSHPTRQWTRYLKRSIF